MKLPTALLPVSILIAAVLIDLWLVLRWRRRQKAPASQEVNPNGSVQFFGAPSHFLTFIRNFRLADLARRMPIGFPWQHARSAPGQEGQQPNTEDAAALRPAGIALPVSLGTFLELAAIILWAAWVGKNLLIFSPYLIPNGNEFSNLTQTHYIWTYLTRCGGCFLWNGSVNGGAPAFAEVSGAILHPLVVLPVLIWGVVDGAKVTIIAGLALAGVAQWILVARLGLGRFARMWSALIIVAGGHLVGKMENGNLGLILGLASANLVLAFGVDLLYNHNRRALPWLAAAVALLILSGEGYIQVGSVLGIFPILAFFIFLSPEDKQRSFKDYALALGLGVMLSGVFLVPLLHFLPQLYKDGDPLLRNYPPLESIPLSLVISDLNYYRTAILGNNPYLYTHMNTIGWVPVLLALLAPQLAPTRLKKLLWTFAAGTVLIFFITSADLPKLLINYIPSIAQLRHLTVASGLVVPMMLTLAAISLDRLLHSTALSLSIQNARGVLFSASLGQVVVIPLAVMAIFPLYGISQELLGTRDISAISAEVQQLKTPSAQWVDPPYGFYDWTTYALDRGMKIANTWRPWFWKFRPSPQPYIKTFAVTGDEVAALIQDDASDYRYIQDPGAEYALATWDAGKQAVACPAVSQGGNIDMICTVKAPGILTVRENAWSGWSAWVDGQRVPLLALQWISVEALPGTHTYQFRYQPLDVWIGLLVSIAGVILTIRARRRIQTDVQAAPAPTTI
jgi:hypothetical protein